ncbi:heavy-metal-associated domain-containing protein [Micromonospora alfalfae]|uniref:heavy-metal-associated domain-containing protein n=1 Tax=Micromonospora alfalfae TaxID=2911212 RepID=UPI0027E055AA|nr:heavy metal-associated domain-containing protein [Micromonospora alfalfae]
MCTSGSSCGCATATADNAPATVDTVGGVQVTYTVSGMTCTGCASNVRRELSTVEGVTSVEIDVAASGVTVTSHTPLAIANVRAAVEKAGYQLVS